MSEGLASLLDGFVARGEEPGGAVCVMRNGETTDEHNVGTRDGTAPWTTDTLVMTYSVAKPFAALTVLAAVAEGHLDLDGAVADWWPAYGVHGKESTTVRQVLSHQAGMPFFPAAAAEVAFDDAEALTALLGGERPGPRARDGCRRARADLRAPLRCPGGRRHGRVAGRALRPDRRRARLGPAPAGAAGGPGAGRGRHGGRSRMAGEVPRRPALGPAMGRPHGLLDPDVLNSARFRTASFPAIAMHASAGGLARFYDDLTDVDGAVASLLGADLYRDYVGAAATGFDRVIGREVTWTLGFQLDEGETGWSEIGMGGAGGCSAWASYANGYAAAYVTRGLGTHDRGEAIWELLEGRGAGGTLGS